MRACQNLNKHSLIQKALSAKLRRYRRVSLKSTFFRRITDCRVSSAVLGGKFVVFLFIFCFISGWAHAEDGYRLWLRYDLIANIEKLSAYKSAITAINFEVDSPIINAAREELSNGLTGLLGTRLPFVQQITQHGALVVGTPQSSKI